MGGYLVVRKDPYAAVSDTDGKFTIKDLPVGKELEFALWERRTPAYLKNATFKGGKADAHGRFKIKLKPGDNDLGDIKVGASLFKAKIARGTIDAGRPSPPRESPEGRNGMLKKTMYMAAALGRRHGVDGADRLRPIGFGQSPPRAQVALDIREKIAEGAADAGGAAEPTNRPAPAGAPARHLQVRRHAPSRAS